MNPLEQVLWDAAHTLDSIGTRWALVGGLAVAARTEPRFTRDVDIAVAVKSDQEAQRTIAEMRDAGFTIVSTLQHDTTAILAAARLAPAGGEAGPVVDLLFASCGIEAEIASHADRITLVAGLDVPVARTGHLLVMKLLSVDDRRPQDRADIAALSLACNDSDVVLANEAVGRLAAQGVYLQDALDRVLRER